MLISTVLVGLTGGTESFFLCFRCVCSLRIDSAVPTGYRGHARGNRSNRFTRRTRSAGMVAAVGSCQ